MTVEDDVKIRNLIARVAWETDHWHSVESYTSNYTEDCSWEVVGYTKPYRGHDGLAQRLREMLAQGICGPGLPSRHCITSLEIILDPHEADVALARSFALMLTTENQRSAVGNYGDYQDTVRRVGDRWLISKRVITIPGNADSLTAMLGCRVQRIAYSICIAWADQMVEPMSDYRRKTRPSYEKLVVIDVKPGAHMESQSGLQMNNPRVYGRIEGSIAGSGVAYVVIHPTSNFMGHYLLEPLRDRGRTILALNTRYVGNDNMLLMERAIQDLGAGVKFLRTQGFAKIVLIGNSGGGSLVALYQQQAEKLTIQTTPDGRPIDLNRDDLPPADAIALLCAHPGRARTLTDMIDPSVIDEGNPREIESSLDMYDGRNGPPFDRNWVASYRAAQRARNQRLTDHALARIAEYDADSRQPLRDLPIVIHRTMADPRNLDLTIDPNDRQKGSIWGDAKSVNYAANGTARFSTLRSFLSQWSMQCSRADGPQCLAATSVPVLSMDYTADQIVFPSQIADWLKAAEGRCTALSVRNVGHYPQSDFKAVTEIADRLVEWGG